MSVATPVASPQQFSAKVDIAASGAIVAAVAGKSIVVTSYALVNLTGTTTLKWQSASTDLTGAITTANNGVITVGCGTAPVLIANPGEALNLTLGANTQVSGHVTYFLA